jgi:hypothetical protein
MPPGPCGIIEHLSGLHALSLEAEREEKVDSSFDVLAEEQEGQLLSALEAERFMCSNLAPQSRHLYS